DDQVEGLAEGFGGNVVVAERGDGGQAGELPAFERLFQRRIGHGDVGDVVGVVEAGAVAVQRRLGGRGNVRADQPRHAVARQLLAHHAVAGAEVEHALAVEVV